MLTTDTIAALPLFDIADVESVYTGSAGCCCGCRGTHTYADAAMARERNGEYDPAKVRRAALRMLRSPDAKRNRDYTEHFVATETQTRTNVVYLRAGAR